MQFKSLVVTISLLGLMVSLGYTAESPAVPMTLDSGTIETNILIQPEALILADGSIVSMSYTNRGNSKIFGYLKSKDPAILPASITNTPGYAPGAIVVMKISGGVTNYTVAKTVAMGVTRPDPEEPTTMMRFKMVMYDDLTDKPMGEISADVNWDKAFAASSVTISNVTATASTRTNTVEDTGDTPGLAPK